MRGGLLLAAALLALPVAADVYRWVDESGRVHFGDRPPAAQGERVEIAPPPDTAPAPRPDTVPDRQRMLDMYQREREERNAAKAEQAKRRAEVERACGRIARDLRRYLAGGPLYENRPDGTRHYFSAAEKDQEMARLRGLLDKHCDGVPADLQPKGGR